MSFIIADDDGAVAVLVDVELRSLDEEVGEEVFRVEDEDGVAIFVSKDGLRKWVVFEGADKGASFFALKIGDDG